MTKRPAPRWRTALLLLGAAALVATACGGSSTSTSGGSSSTTSAAAAAVDTAAGGLGTPKPATGTPVTIGYSFDGASDAVDNSDEIVGTKAAVDYANQYLGGIGGHPIKLDICSTNLDPAKATACVTQFARNDAVAVLAHSGGQAQIEFPPLAKQGIPVLLGSTSLASLVNDPNVFVLHSGKILSGAAPAKLAQNVKAKAATLFVIDIPSAAQSLRATAPGFYKKAGVDLDIVQIPADTADFAPHVQAALTKKPSQFFLVGTSQFCTRAINAIEAAGFSGQIVGLQFCFDENSKKTVTKLAGVKVIAGNSFDHDDAEYKLYAAVMEKFASKKVELDGAAPAANGFTVALAFARAASGLQGAATRESVRAAISSMPAQKLPIGGGLTFQCNRPDPTQISVCSAGALGTTLDADGKPAEYEVLDVSNLLK
jgi:branched-chain amino acid transport system substrate-binding protein